MFSKEELTKKEKALKKLLRDLGGLGEIFTDVRDNYQAQLDSIKKILRAEKTLEENKASLFGKGAKLKKEATSELDAEHLHLEELSGAQAELDKKIEVLPTISKERTTQLSAMVKDFKTEEMKALPFEELATCFSAGIGEITKLNSAENKNEILLEKYNLQQKELHRVFLEALKNMENYFIMFSPATRCPYMDFRETTGQATMWLFTKEDYAKNCRNFFARQYIFTDVVKVEKKDFATLAKNLPRWGFTHFTLNNGVHNLTIELSALIGKIQYSCPINPMLHTRRFDFFQSLLLFNKVPQTNHKLYEQYHNPVLMKAKESVMLHELYKAKYTLVMKIIKGTDANGNPTESSEIPTNVKDDVRFLLIFTDMLEFDNWKRASGFKTDEEGFTARVVDFNVVDKMARETGSELLLDRTGWCFEFVTQRRDAVIAVAQQVEKLEAERKKKEENK